MFSCLARNVNASPHRARRARSSRPVLKPHLLLAEVHTPDGGMLSLYQHERTFTIRLNGHGLMDSSMSTSERMLADLAIESPSARHSPRILIGGLGLGFTLRRVLETTGPGAVVDVAELIPEVVEWNRVHLRDLNGSCLDDPRVRVLVDDVAHVIATAEPGTYDSILLDIDNGPIALVQRKNARLYDHAGITQMIRALKRGGRVAIWSAGRDQRFFDRLTGWGLSVKHVPAKTHGRAKRSTNTIYVVDRAE